MKPHKHAAVIKAWADGATVQFHDSEGIWRTINDNPYWEEQSEYRASIAEVEGKPVFEGDVLYSPEGKQFKAHPYETMFHFASWNPPEPKTITVTIPRPRIVGTKMSDGWAEMLFSDNGARQVFLSAIKEAMK